MAKKAKMRSQCNFPRFREAKRPSEMTPPPLPLSKFSEISSKSENPVIPKLCRMI